VPPGILLLVPFPMREAYLADLNSRASEKSRSWVTRKRPSAWAVAQTSAPLRRHRPPLLQCVVFRDPVPGQRKDGSCYVSQLDHKRETCTL